MLYQDCKKHRLQKPIFSPLDTEWSQQDPSLKARRRGAQQNHAYGCCSFFHLETLDFRAAGKVAWTSAPLSSLAHQQTRAPCGLRPSSGHWRPLPGRSGSALAQARNETRFLRAAKTGALAASNGLSGNCI